MTWDAGCEHTMTTNHFELAPGATSEPIFVDFSGCTAEEKDRLLFFGYVTSKNGSRQITKKDNVRLTMTPFDPSTEEVFETASEDGYALTALPPEETGCWLFAENLNKRKTLKLRLRSSLIGQ